MGVPVRDVGHNGTTGISTCEKMTGRSEKVASGGYVGLAGVFRLTGVQRKICQSVDLRFEASLALETSFLAQKGNSLSIDVSTCGPTAGAGPSAFRPRMFNNLSQIIKLYWVL